MTKRKEMANNKFFERNKKLINRFTRSFLAKNKVGVVHGTRATNSQLPRRLKRKTLDWDIFVKKPKRRAKQLEKILDKRFGGDFFRVKKGMGSPGVNVFKIIANKTNEGVVDFATPNRQVNSVALRGVKFATLKDQKRIAENNVRNKKLGFRRAKDSDLLRRIRQFEKIRGRKI